MRVGIVPTSEPWALAWSAHLRDHTEVDLSYLADPHALWDTEWAALLVDADSILLTVQVVEEARERGRQVIAVVTPATKERAVTAGVGAMVEADATPAELLSVLRAVERELPRRRVSSRPRVHAPSSSAGALVVVGGPSRHRVALGAAVARGLSAPLVEGDEVSPSLSQRLGVEPVPNLASAVLSVRAGEVAQTSRVGDLDVIVGLAEPAQWAATPPQRVSRVLDGLLREGPVVAVAGPCCETDDRFALTASLVSDATVLVVVSDATPTGVAAASHWIAGARRLSPTIALHVALVGRASASQRSHLIDRAFELGDPTDVFCLPLTERAERRSEWLGSLPKLDAGHLLKSLAPVVRV